MDIILSIIIMVSVMLVCGKIYLREMAKHKFANYKEYFKKCDVPIPFTLLFGVIVICAALLFLYTNAKAWDNGKSSLTLVEQVMFTDQCPYGDVVIDLKSEFSKKGLLIGTKFVCADYNQSTGLWETWDILDNKRVIRHIFDPLKYDVHNEDGALIINDNKVVLIPYANN